MDLRVASEGCHINKNLLNPAELSGSTKLVIVLQISIAKAHHNSDISQVLSLPDICTNLNEMARDNNVDFC